VHTTATRRVLERIPSEQSGAYVEEGRLLLVALMGHLASHYRALAMGRIA
jgi:hypothetical protein